MSKDLEALFECVCDEDTLVKYMVELSKDWERSEVQEKMTPSPSYSSGHGGWENGSIGAFLEASSAWANSSKDGLKFYQLPDNPWKRFAEMLHAGKHYE